MQALVTTALQADQHMQASAWLGKLANVPGPLGADLHQALFTCIANTASSPTSGQGWRLLSRPILGFAVALLEKGNVKADELGVALSGFACPLEFSRLQHRACFRLYIAEDRLHNMKVM